MREEHVQTSETSRRGLKEALLGSLDLFAAGLAGLLVVLEFTVGVLPRTPTEPIREELSLARARLAESLEDPMPELATREAEVSRALGDLQRAVRGGTREAPEPIATTWPADLLAARRAGVGNAILFRPPSGLSGSAERGVNELSWQTDPDDNVPTTGFVLLRTEEGGSEQEIARLGGDVSVYEDRDVTAGRAYVYRVRGTTEDTEVPLARRTTPASNALTLVAATDFRLTILGADRTAGTVRLQVEKWHDGAWWPRAFTLKRGSDVGTRDPGSGVDYRTGRRLAALRFEDRDEARTLQEPVFQPDGQVRVENGQVVREARTVDVRVETVTVRLEGGNLPPRELSLERIP